MMISKAIKKLWRTEKLWFFEEDIKQQIIGDLSRIANPNLPNFDKHISKM